MEVSCKDSKNCHPSVAALEIQLPEIEAQAVGVKYDYCTGFLIDKDRILTNSHCVYGRLLPITRPGKSCSIVSVHFPAVGKYKEEQVGCFLVETFGDGDPRQNEDVPDYMILRLSRPVKRPIIALRNEPLKDDEIHRNFAFDFTPKEGAPTKAEQRVEPRCRLDMKNDLKPFDELSPTVFYKDCGVEPGNSGSVMIDPSGKAAGLAMAKVKTSGNKTYDGKDLFSHAGLAVNLACFESFLGTEKNPKLIEKCDVAKNVERMAVFSQALYGNILKRRDENLHSQAKQLAIIKQYESYAKISYTPEGNYSREHGNYEETAFPRISCVTRTGAERFPVVHMLLPRFTVHAAFNKDYRLEYLGEKETLMKVQSAVQSIGQTQVEMILTVTIDGRVERPTKVKFPLCP